MMVVAKSLGTSLRREMDQTVDGLKPTWQMCLVAGSLCKALLRMSPMNSESWLRMQLVQSAILQVLLDQLHVLTHSVSIISELW